MSRKDTNCGKIYFLNIMSSKRWSCFTTSGRGGFQKAGDSLSSGTGCRLSNRGCCCLSYRTCWCSRDWWFPRASSGSGRFGAVFCFVVFGHGCTQQICGSSTFCHSKTRSLCLFKGDFERFRFLRWTPSHLECCRGPLARHLRRSSCREGFTRILPSFTVVSSEDIRFGESHSTQSGGDGRAVSVGLYPLEVGLGRLLADMRSFGAYGVFLYIRRAVYQHFHGVWGLEMGEA